MHEPLDPAGLPEPQAASVLGPIPALLCSLLQSSEKGV